MERREHFVENGDGWTLGLSQFWDPETLKSDRRPLAIIPGYGMNGFIFSYHPRGRSMAESLVVQGFEVWVINLRGQEPSRSTGGKKEYNLRDLAAVDMKVAVETVLEHSKTSEKEVDLIGASLGGTIAFLHQVLVPDSPIGSVVSIGGPLRWVDVHPLLRYTFGSRVIARLAPTCGTRHLAAIGLPLLKHVPWLLSIYLHPNLVDMSAADQLVKTVEDPNRRLNLEISRWLRSSDLDVDGINLTEAYGRVKSPLLCVIANGDGIVPEATALSALQASGAEVREELRVGNQQVKYAHADLFIANDAEALVFKPLGGWLAGRYSN